MKANRISRQSPLPRPLAVATALMACGLVAGGWGSCEPSLNQDPSFDLWCGESLCAWRTDAGAVRRVPTWHERDYGVELVGDPAGISQLIGERVRCFRFETLAEVEGDASVVLGMDFEDDGTEEYFAPVPGNDWAAVMYTVRTPTWYTKVRFSLRKTGPGRARLAHLRISDPGDCSGAPLPLEGRPLGATCERDGQCASGVCGPSGFPYRNADDQYLTCGECRQDADCSGDTCGLVPDEFGLHAACVPEGSRHLGERCLQDRECASGVCCSEVCSSCCDIVACPDGLLCTLAEWPAEQNRLWQPRPWQCAPGQGRAESGAACLRDEDCQSRRCVGSGALTLCWYDGRSCQSDGDCPPDHASGDCVALGVSDGRCQ
ncbi:MAG: hypothetical protein GYA21_13205 [Myxococcales bacterium]|nr:hypothetical protein [Myxococcales bacterium]